MSAYENFLFGQRLPPVYGGGYHGGALADGRVDQCAALRALTLKPGGSVPASPCETGTCRIGTTHRPSVTYPSGVTVLQHRLAAALASVR